jgi:hypothetical protein
MPGNNAAYGACPDNNFFFGPEEYWLLDGREVIVSLKKQVVERQGLANGCSYKFEGSDSIMNELNEFIKTERQCCDFFDFCLTVKGNASSTILTIAGPDGTKAFITSELGL